MGVGYMWAFQFYDINQIIRNRNANFTLKRKPRKKKKYHIKGNKNEIY